MTNVIESLSPVWNDIQSLTDQTGLKLANVFFYTKKEGAEPVWKQILPTPSIREIDEHYQLTEGGILEKDDIILKGIPLSFNYSDLETATSEGSDRFWIINEKAYTTVRIERLDLSWTVVTRRFVSINKGELSPPDGM